MQKKAITL